MDWETLQGRKEKTIARVKAIQNTDFKNDTFSNDLRAEKLCTITVHSRSCPYPSDTQRRAVNTQRG